VFSLDGAGHLPLGVALGTRYHEKTEQLLKGDRILFYTDGVTEAQNKEGDLFGIHRVDRVLSQCASDADELLGRLLEAIAEYTEAGPPSDDRTMLVADVR
jgi:sigma-B regulation protein RsbU (phosphoserine phosphatase)